MDDPTRNDQSFLNPRAPAWRPDSAPPPQRVVVVAPKSPGIAVLLSFLWLGAGNLYVNQIGAGVTLLLVNLILVVMAASIVGAVLAVPAWLLLFAVAAATSASAASRHNRVLGTGA